MQLEGMLLLTRMLPTLQFARDSSSIKISAPLWQALVSMSACSASSNLRHLQRNAIPSNAAHQFSVVELQYTMLSLVSHAYVAPATAASSAANVI
jgi:hypothetical protein